MTAEIGHLFIPFKVIINVKYVGIPSKFTSVDKSEHILAASAGSSIIFWDLRKMKQRSIFNDSFNDEILHIRF